MTLQEEKSTCKGLFFRAVRNKFYIKEKRIVEHLELRFLKKKSCPGCEKCDFLWYDLQESDESISLSHIEQDKIYSPVITNISRDWETGYIEDWEIEFQEIKGN